MTFTFSQLPIGTPEQTSPWGNMMANAMKQYQQGVQAEYAPQQMKADIFSKEIGPLAALASNPNFRGFNPETQKMISDRIGAYLGGKGQEGSQSSSMTAPGYASPQDIYKNLTSGANAVASSGGRGNVAKSRLAGEIEKSGLPGSHAISGLLGGNKAAGQSAAFEQAKAQALHQLQLQGYSRTEAEKVVEIMPGESNEDYANRIKPFFMSQQNQDGGDSPNTYNPDNENEAPIRSLKQLEKRQNNEREHITKAMENSDTTKVALVDPDGQTHFVSPASVASVKAHWKKQMADFSKKR